MSTQARQAKHPHPFKVRAMSEAVELPHRGIMMEKVNAVQIVIRVDMPVSAFDALPHQLRQLAHGERIDRDSGQLNLPLNWSFHLLQKHD
jgi:hypothetical protein